MLQVNVPMLLRARGTAVFGIALVLMCGCDSDHKEVETKVQRIHQLISVGMALDDATAKLKQEGFRVGEKYQPTKAADYWQVNVPLRDEMPFSETARYTAGMKEGEKKMYVVIKADPNGTILSID